MTQRITPVLALEIVLGPKQPLPSGLALAARNCPQCVEPTRDGAEEALFGFHIGRNGTKQRRLRLVGPVGPAEALDRSICLPTGFEQIVDAQAPISSRQLGMVAPPRAARVGEHEDALDVIHEGRCLGEIGRTGSIFDQQSVALADDASRAAGHFGDHVGAEALHDLIQRAGYRRQRSEFLDEAAASCYGFPALNRLAIAINGPRAEVALRVRERFVELDREGVGEIVEHILARGDIDLDVTPVFGRDLGEPALHQGFAR